MSGSSIPLRIRRDASKLSACCNGPVVATLGNFDGVHRGHLSILNRLVEIKHELASKSGKEGTVVLVSFYPHPVTVLGKGGQVPTLTTLRQKQLLLAKAGVDLLYLVHFTETFSQWSAEKFIDDLLLKTLQVSRLVIGPDARVGFRRQGTPEFISERLARSGVTTEVFPFISEEGNRISSGGIRTMLLAGEVEAAHKALGYRYALEARVIKGDGRGRTIGIPTANLAPTSQILPARGVYATLVQRENGSIHYSVTNIGIRPTFDGGKVCVESHILEGVLPEFYGERIQLHFVSKIRDEMRFSGATELVKQIKLDVAEAAKRLSRIN